MVRGGAYHRQAGGEVDSVLEGKRLERSEALVVIHREGGVELLIVSETEESVRGERPEGEYAFFGGSPDGRYDDAALLVPEQASVAAVGVEAEHRDARLVHAEILLQRFVHQAELAEYLLLGDLARHVLERDVSRHHAHLDAAADHQHGDVLYPESILDVLGVSGESEALSCHRLLVDGSGHQHVDVSGLEVLYGLLQAGDCGLCGFRRGLSRFRVGVLREAVDYVHALLVHVPCGADGVGVHLLYFGDGLAVETENLGGAVDDRRELLEYARVGEGLDDDFVSDAVGIALGDSDCKFSHI